MDEGLKNRIKQVFDEKLVIIEDHLDKILPSSDEFPELLHEAIRYSVFTGGKRLRPVLVLLTCEILGGLFSDALNDAIVLELFHTQSLVLDDLPAMDDDDYRRGKLACHKQYGEDIALMVAFGLNALANQFISPHLCCYVATMLGTQGMVGGQVVDLDFQKNPDTFNRETMRRLHQMKTGNAIEASVVVGARWASVSEDILDKMAQYGRSLGLLFQITDDALDDNDYVCVVGREQTRKDIDECVDQALAAIDFLKSESYEVMKGLVLYVRERTV